MVHNIDLEMLKDKLEKLKKQNMIKIFTIIYNNEDNNNYNINNDGIFVPLNLLKQSTIDKINVYLNKVNHFDILNNLKQQTKTTKLSHNDLRLLKKINLNNDLYKYSLITIINNILNM